MDQFPFLLGNVCLIFKQKKMQHFDILIWQREVWFCKNKISKECRNEKKNVSNQRVIGKYFIRLENKLSVLLENNECICPYRHY